MPTSYLDPRVTEVLPAFLARFEGNCSWPYLDAKGIITIGIGIVLPLSRAQQLEFICVPSGRRATGLDLKNSYLALSELTPGLGGGHYENATIVRATEATLNILFAEKAEGFARDLADPSRFANYLRSPLNCQLALMRMAWAMGGAFVDPDEQNPMGRWPRFHTAFLAEQWGVCASECRMNEAGQPPQFAQSNRAVKWLFEDASSADSVLRLPPIDV